MQLDQPTLELIGEFTYRFIRLERSLIDRNYSLANRKGYLFPNFSEYCLKDLNEIDINNLADLLELKKPISKRCSDKNGKIDWLEVLGVSRTICDYLLKVDNVRDNLFHGSKVLDNEDRDKKLIQESIKFLKLLQEHDKEYGKYL